MVHCLIGNHEAMNMYGDLRFVSPAEYQHYETPDSAAVRDRAYEDFSKASQAYAAQNPKANPPQSKADWMAAHPLGFVEQRQAFAPDGQYGKWILSHDAVIRINGTLYSNAGIGPKYANQTLDQINRSVREELANPGKLAGGGTITDLQGPLWYQGFSIDSKADPALDATLKKFNAVRQVIGHDDAGGAVMPEFANRVILIDVGLAKNKKGEARQACLLEQNGQLFAVHRGAKLPLPMDDGKDMLRYLKQAAALDPEPSPLAGRIQSLETK